MIKETKMLSKTLIALAAPQVLSQGNNGERYGYSGTTTTPKPTTTTAATTTTTTSTTTTTPADPCKVNDQNFVFFFSEKGFSSIYINLLLHNNHLH